MIIIMIIEGTLFIIMYPILYWIIVLIMIYHSMINRGHPYESLGRRRCQARTEGVAGEVEVA
jgi:hypothetical protein